MSICSRLHLLSIVIVGDFYLYDWRRGARLEIMRSIRYALSNRSIRSGAGPRS